MNKKRLGHRRGFTLIELMVAVAIVAVLVMVGFASYIRSQKRALDARRQGDMKAFQNAMEQYYSVEEVYPEDDTEAATQFSGGSLPKDPINNTEFFYNRTYSGGSTYCACAKLVVMEGNSGIACNFSETNPEDKIYFCVENLQ